jgi:hypothetical protein
MDHTRRNCRHGGYVWPLCHIFDGQSRRPPLLVEKKSPLRCGAGFDTTVCISRPTHIIELNL